jgi:putative CocE/NonD family hydrolase
MRHVILVCAAALAATLQASPPQRAGAAEDAVVEKNAEARMRDGVILRADIYRPPDAGKHPALVQRTPYSKNDSGAAERFKALAARDYVVVVQDTRGRYASDGVARPHDEAEDGYDTLAWVAGLPYVNGRIGMWGGSYLATTQLLAATQQPPALVALYPSSSYASRYDMVFQGGAFYLNDGLGWNLGQAADVRRRVLTPDVDRDGPIGMTAEQREAFRERWLWHVPLETMDALELRRYAPAYFDMLAHPSFDEYWKTFDVGSRHDRIQAPALHVTGWYDTLLNGTLANYTGLRAHAATPRAREGQRLVIGPWTHARPSRNSTRLGDVDFGPAAGLDSQDLMARWFDYWLKDGNASAISGPPVRIFVMGENRWRDEQEWPLARARQTRYFLHSAGRANTLDGDGRLSTDAPRDEPPDTFVYDPWNPVPTGALGGYSRMPADQRETERRPDVLVYTTEPLATDVEVTGPISLTLWIASSARDTDFTGKLVDVLPDGTARALNDGILRVRYRNGRTKPDLITPDEPVEIAIDLGATSNLFRAGHRIRLEVSSSNFPRFDRNPNTGGVFGKEGELKRTRQRVFHDASRPSFVTLPVIPR